MNPRKCHGTSTRVPFYPDRRRTGPRPLLGTGSASGHSHASKPPTRRGRYNEAAVHQGGRAAPACRGEVATTYACASGVPQTAGCGPACPVVWEGDSGRNPLPPIPIMGTWCEAEEPRAHEKELLGHHDLLVEPRWVLLVYPVAEHQELKDCHPHSRRQALADVILPAPGQTFATDAVAELGLGPPPAVHRLRKENGCVQSRTRTCQAI